MAASHPVLVLNGNGLQLRSISRWRGCALLAIALAFPTSSGALKRHNAASKMLPDSRPLPWENAVRQLYELPAALQLTADRATADSKLLWSSGAPHKCGTPCVAHCVVGQPRQVLESEAKLQEYWGNLKKNAFDSFSEDPVVFSVLSVAENKALSGRLSRRGDAHPRGVAPDKERLQWGLDFLNASRVLIVNETCKSATCFAKQSRIGFCDFEHYETVRDEHGHYHRVLNQSLRDDHPDTSSRVPKITSYNMCDVQVGRLEQCMHLVEEYEAEHAMKFDWVMRHRADTLWTNPSVSASSLDQRSVYMTPWKGRACYGGFDWFYAIPRSSAEDLSRFKEEITCDHARQVPSWDAFYNTSTKCRQQQLGCEGWLASWMYSRNVSFAPLPLLNGKAPRLRLTPTCKGPGCGPNLN